MSSLVSPFIHEATWQDGKSLLLLCTIQLLLFTAFFMKKATLKSRVLMRKPEFDLLQKSLGTKMKNLLPKALVFKKPQLSPKEMEGSKRF